MYGATGPREKSALGRADGFAWRYGTSFNGVTPVQITFPQLQLMVSIGPAKAELISESTFKNSVESSVPATIPLQARYRSTESTIARTVIPSSGPVKALT